MISVSVEGVVRVADVVKGLYIEEFNLTDPRFYPPPGEDEERVLRYLMSMVAIDHRASRPGRAYQSEVDGETFRGADLLYRLGMLKYMEDPDFFSPESLSKVSYGAILRWLKAPSGALPANVRVRWLLLRDLGRKLMSLYGGEAKRLFNSAGWRTSGLLGVRERLKVFLAYSDPVEKKSNLLLKFVLRRGLPIKDPWNIDVPVDNHLTRIAVRLGLVEYGAKLRPLLTWKRRASWDEDVVIRLMVRRAYRLLGKLSHRPPHLLDDFLWVFGRTLCLREGPRCEVCPFKDVCKAYGEGELILKEHLYYNTWYY